MAVLRLEKGDYGILPLRKPLDFSIQTDSGRVFGAGSCAGRVESKKVEFHEAGIEGESPVPTDGGDQTCVKSMPQRLFALQNDPLAPAATHGQRKLDAGTATREIANAAEQGHAATEADGRPQVSFVPLVSTSLIAFGVNTGVHDQNSEIISSEAARSFEG